MQKPALLIIDLLNDYRSKWKDSEWNELISAVNELANAFRRSDLPVIFIRQEFEPDLSDAFPEMRAKNISICIKGTTGADFDPALQRYPDEPVIIKKRYSAFFGTSMDFLLTEMQIDGLVLAGINTHACIRMTAIDAYQRDLPVIIAVECVGSSDKDHHYTTLRYLEDKIALLRTNAEIAVLLAE